MPKQPELNKIRISIYALENFIAIYNLFYIDNSKKY